MQESNFQVLENTTTGINDNLMNATIHQKRGECSKQILKSCCDLISNGSSASDGIENRSSMSGEIGFGNKSGLTTSTSTRQTLQ